MSANVKRTKAAGSAALDGQAGLPGIPPDGWGVGKTPPALPAGGGGYLDIRTPFDFLVPAGAEKNSRDPRLADMEKMGLRATFIRIAEAIGVDNFLTMWQILDSDPSFIDHGPSAMRIHMPPFRAWQRYMRNRYIEALFRAGLSDEEVLQRLERGLREKLTKRHVARFKNSR